MTHSAAFPFTFRRSHDVVGLMEILSTRETVHGLLRLDGDRLVLQWRVSRATDRVGDEIRTDTEHEPVREVVLRLSDVASVAVRWHWGWPPGRRLVLTAADLRAFEEITGAAGLGLDHPAELMLPVRRKELASAEEFSAELAVAIAERS